MGLTLTEVHKFRKVKGSQQWVLSKTTPYVRLRRGSEPPLFIQEGKVYSEGGEEIKDLPEWFHEEVKKLSQEAKIDVGLTGSSAERKTPKTTETPKLADKKSAREYPSWVCPQCNKTMTTRQKGFHVANHQRDKREKG